jgi:hypothetical protein
MFSACDNGIAGGTQIVQDIHVLERGGNDEMEAVNKLHSSGTFALLIFRQHTSTQEPHVGCISENGACDVDQ